MKKLMMILFAGFLGAFMLTGCDNKKLESSWEKGKKIHVIAEAAGAAAIKHDVVSKETAQKLKKINSTVKTGGVMTETIYQRVKPPESKEAK